MMNRAVSSGSLVIRCVYRELEARQCVLIAVLLDVVAINLVCLLVCQHLQLIEVFFVLLEVVERFAAQLLNVIVTVLACGVIVHHKHHVLLGQVNLVADGKSLVILVRLNDLLRGDA